MKLIHAFIFGCDIDKWTKDTTIEQQHEWAQAVQNYLRQGVEKVENELGIKPNNRNTYLMKSTGDGAFVVFFHPEMIEAPFNLAVYMRSISDELPCSIGIALHCGIVSILKDANNEDDLSGDGISDTSRLLGMARNWEIISSSAYSSHIKNINSSLRQLFSLTPTKRKDKHGKDHSFYYVSGHYNGLFLGDQDAKEQEHKIEKNKVGFQSFAQLQSHLSIDRKNEILKEYKKYIVSKRFYSHRKIHASFIKNKQKQRKVSYNHPAWSAITTTDTNSGYRLVIGFQNQGCEYRKTDVLGVGCFHCGFYAGRKTPPKKVLISALQSQFYNGLKFGNEYGPQFDAIEFLSDGSFFNDKEIPERTKQEIFKALREMPHLKRILVESTPNFIYEDQEEVIARIKSLRNNQELEIGIGLESADDFVRKVCLNKNFMKPEFEKALAFISQLPANDLKRIRIDTYLFVNPPWLTEQDAINDTVLSIEYIQKLSQKYDVDIIPKIEPAIISRGTLLSLLWEEKEYSPLNYWIVIEILCRVYFHETCSTMLRKIRIGSRSDMDDSIIIPGIYKEGRFDQFDFVLYRAVQEFNQHKSLEKMFSFLHSIYSIHNSSIKHKSQSLHQWLNNAFPRNNSSITKFLSLNKKQIEDGVIDDDIMTESKYIYRLFKVLDIVEAYEADSFYFEYAKTWRDLYLACSTMEDIRELKLMIEKEINATLHTRLKFTHAYVTEVELEHHDEKLFRICMHINDFLREKSYEIWAGIPTS